LQKNEFTITPTEAPIVHQNIVLSVRQVKHRLPAFK